MPFGLPKYGHGIGFRRILAFCDAEGIELETMGSNSIVITGSNGKGSTTRFVYELLQTKFRRVGCFTSPHLRHVTERFEISGAQISEAAFECYKERVLAFAHQDQLGAFELLFLIAVLWFRDEDVQCAVWEAGIGGRYDPVRTLRSPLSALTSIDLEHTELLGATPQLIAFDKLDATRPAGRTFISPSVRAELRPELEAFARITGRALQFVEVSGVQGRDSYTTTLNGERIDVKTPLLGIHQLHNSATALHVANAFTPLDAAAAIGAIARTRWPGRLEKIASDPEIWIDVGHTPEALAVTIDTLESMFNPAELLVVFGVSHNKAVGEIAGMIRSHFANVLVTQAYQHGTDAETLARDSFGGAPFARRIEEAVERSRHIAAERGLKIAVLGGLFLAIEFAEAVEGRDPRKLEFF